MQLAGWGYKPSINRQPVLSQIYFCTFVIGTLFHFQGRSATLNPFYLFIDLTICARLLYNINMQYYYLTQSIDLVAVYIYKK